MYVRIGAAKLFGVDRPETLGTGAIFGADGMSVPGSYSRAIVPPEASDVKKAPTSLTKTSFSFFMDAVLAVSMPRKDKTVASKKALPKSRASRRSAPKPAPKRKGATAKARATGDAGDQFNFMDEMVVPVLVGKDPVLQERPLTPRQKHALMAQAPDLYRACLAMRSYLSGDGRNPMDVVAVLDDVLGRAVPTASS